MGGEVAGAGGGGGGGGTSLCSVEDVLKRTEIRMKEGNRGVAVRGGKVAVSQCSVRDDIYVCETY